MPRQRPKRGERRIDAAIDHFTPMGYSSADIRAVVKQLLGASVYGDDGWPFLEEDSYRVVQEALFEKQEHDEQLQLQLLQQQDDDEQAEEEPQPQLQPLQQIELEEEEGPQMEEQSQLQLLQKEDDVREEEEPQAMSVDLPAVAAILPPPAPRRPCYGWLSESDTETESDNEEHSESLLCKRRRPSRWDVRPPNW